MIHTVSLESFLEKARTPALEAYNAKYSCHEGPNTEYLTYGQIADYAQYGDDSLVSEAEQMIDSLSVSVETHGRQWEPTVCGAYGVIPEYLAGRPQCMRGMKHVESESSPVRLVVDLFASCGATGKQLRDRGIVILSLAMLLSRHRPVSLEILLSTTKNYSNPEPCGLLIPVPSRPFNVSVVSSLFRPAFVRKLMFAYAGKVLKVDSSIPADSYGLCLKELELGPKDLYIERVIGYSPALNEMLGNPQVWLQKQLDRFMGSE